MSRETKGARLWLGPDTYSADGKLRRRARWIIRDGSRYIRTGCAREERERAEEKLGEYIASKYKPPRFSGRHPSKTSVIDVLNIYNDDIAPKHARPIETGQRLLKLAEFWEPYTLADVNGARCRQYVKWRTKQPWRSAKAPKLSSESLPLDVAKLKAEMAAAHPDHGAPAVRREAEEDWT